MFIRELISSIKFIRIILNRFELILQENAILKMDHVILCIISCHWYFRTDDALRSSFRNLKFHFTSSKNFEGVHCSVRKDDNEVSNNACMQCGDLELCTFSKVDSYVFGSSNFFLNSFLDSFHSFKVSLLKMGFFWADIILKMHCYSSLQSC